LFALSFGLNLCIDLREGHVADMPLHLNFWESCTSSDKQPFYNIILFCEAVFFEKQIAAAGHLYRSDMVFYP